VTPSSLTDPPAPDVWHWAEDGGPIEAGVVVNPIPLSSPPATTFPLAVEIELPAVEGAAGPYLALSDDERSATVRGDRGRATRRTSRNSPGLLSHLVGVVGGGMMGLVIAYYLLNWIGGPQYNFLELNLPGLARESADVEESGPTTSPDWERFLDQPPPSGRLMFDDESAEDAPAAPDE
jgi:hypothetical protein